MKVVVIGAGRIGACLVKYLLEESCDVTVVDEKVRLIEQITDHYDVTGICGNGASPQILNKIGMTSVDVVIAVSSNDETNVLACMLARQMGAAHTVARVRSNDFIGDLDYIKKTMDIDLLINPEYKAAEEIERVLNTPTAVSVLEFMSGNVQIAEITMTEKHPLVGKTLKEIRPMLGASVLIPMVRREKKTVVPSGDFVLQVNDVVSILAKKDQLQLLLEKLSLVHRPVKRVMMVGCGTIGYYLAKRLEEAKKKLTIVEFSKERCMELNEEFPNATIVYGDGVEGKMLSEEGLDKCDACVSVTGTDDTNLVISMFAWSLGVPKIVTKILNTGYAEVLRGVSIDNTISPHLICAYEILQFIRSLENKGGTDQLQHLYRMAQNKAEVLEFLADDFPHFDVPLKDAAMKLKKGVLVTAIIRGEETIIPDGNACIKKGDRVLIITTTNHKINRLTHILAV